MALMTGWKMCIRDSIKDDLKEMLATEIALLRANNQLTENTKVDVNAEVMPEVRKDGAVEYNMKVRYDVPVSYTHLDVYKRQQLYS